MALSTLDFYLAHAFIAYPAIWAELEARGADAVEARHVHQWIVDMSTHRFEDQNLGTYIDHFGPPSETRDGVHVWSLGLWPDHEWTVAFHEQGWPVTSIGIVRKVPGQPQRVSPLSVEGAKRALRLGYDTFAEVRAALGDAPRVDGWWPWESFEYDLADGSPLQCVFMNGILVDINQQTISG